MLLTTKESIISSVTFSGPPSKCSTSSQRM